MDKEKILKLQQKVYEYALKSDKYAQMVALECQKYCDFKIKFGHNDPSDGLVLCYDSEYEDVQMPVDDFIKLYEKLKRNITLDDVPIG